MRGRRAKIRCKKVVERRTPGNGCKEEKKGSEQRHAVIRFAPKEQNRKRETDETARKIAQLNQNLEQWSELSQAVRIGVHALRVTVIARQRAKQNNRRQHGAYEPCRVRASHFTLLWKIYGHEEPCN